jgi:hypothetical protein
MSLGGLVSLVVIEKCFALKGVAPVNMFVNDMPRLSVDIDLLLYITAMSLIIKKNRFCKGQAY